MSGTPEDPRPAIWLWKGLTALQAHSQLDRCTILLHVALNEFTHDSRVLKETESIVLAQSNASLWIVALKGKDVCQFESLDDARRIWRVPLSLRTLPKDLFSQTLKYTEWMIRVLVRFWYRRPKIVHCHDLNALPLGVLMKISRGSVVVYDAHELETQVHASRGYRKSLLKLAERCLIPFVDHMITVSDAIADDYVDRYRIRRPLVVRNVPKAVTLGSTDRLRLRATADIPGYSRLYLYQGQLSSGRGIEKLLNVFHQAIPRDHIVFMGNGPLTADIQSAADRCARIHHVPAVPPEQVLRHTVGADIGICLIEDTCLSYRYSLPNKLFEYIVAGVPVIVNDVPEQRRLIEAWECGWVVRIDDQSLSLLMNRLSEEEIRAKRRNTERTARNLEWDKEVEPICGLYRVLRGG